MFNLGVLELEQGNPEAARRRWSKATATGHPEAAARARQELRELDRREEERRRADHFGRYGWQAYADPQLMKSDGRRQAPGEPGDDNEEQLPGDS